MAKRYWPENNNFIIHKHQSRTVPLMNFLNVNRVTLAQTGTTIQFPLDYKATFSPQIHVKEYFKMNRNFHFNNLPAVNNSIQPQEGQMYITICGCGPTGNANDGSFNR
jgi:hypothetical protein